nr:hypothetical protein [Tanacetum cinerariifolium]
RPVGELHQVKILAVGGALQGVGGSGQAGSIAAVGVEAAAPASQRNAPVAIDTESRGRNIGGAAPAAEHRGVARRKQPLAAPARLGLVVPPVISSPPVASRSSEYAASAPLPPSSVAQRTWLKLESRLATTPSLGPPW